MELLKLGPNKFHNSNDEDVTNILSKSLNSQSCTCLPLESNIAMNGSGEAGASHCQTEPYSRTDSGSDEDYIRTIACFVWAQNKLGVAVYDCSLNEVDTLYFHARVSERILELPFWSSMAPVLSLVCMLQSG